MAKKILLIDYESHFAERVRGVLREPDYEVVAARDGEEALSAFSASSFELVLLSGMLPRLPSAEVIREIHRRGGATAPSILLMVSGYKGSNPKADAQRVGAFDLLARPFSDEALLNAAVEAIAASEVTVRTARGRRPEPGDSDLALTSSDIFSDILEEVAREAASSPAFIRPARATEDEVERRLRDTVSDLLPKPAGPHAKSPARSSTSEDVERLLSETLSGLRRPPRGRSLAAEPKERVSQPAIPGSDGFGESESSARPEAPPAAAKEGPWIPLPPEATASREPVVEPPGIFAGSFPDTSAESDGKKRTRLYVLIAAAGVVLAVAAWWVARKPAAPPSELTAATPQPATPAAIASAVTRLPTPAPPDVADQKAIQEEAQRQLAAKRRQIEQKVAEASAKPTRAPAESKVPLRAAPTAAPPPEPSPEAKIAQVQPAKVEPTAAPVVVEPPPTAPPRATAVKAEPVAEVSRGDLVGPGPGVVEPELVSAPRIAYPPVARQQAVAGKVVVLVLVNEEGAASEVRLQHGLSAKFGINEAVLDSIRRGKFRPATKDGIPVKMWRTIVVDVKP